MLRASDDDVNESRSPAARASGEAQACRSAGIDLRVWEIVDRVDFVPQAGDARLLVVRSRSDEWSGDLGHEWSTNSLSLMRLDDLDHVHKRYRHLRADQHEPQVLQALAGTTHTAAYSGHYTYWPPGRSCSLPLGVIYRYVPGRPLDALLRDSLRAVLTASVPAPHGRRAGAAGPSTLPGAGPYPLGVRAELRVVGRALSEYHADLAAAFGRGPLYDARGCVERISEATVRMTGQVLGDPILNGERRHGLAAALRWASDEAVTLAQAAPPIRSAPCHGDLHLAHVIVRSPTTTVTGPASRPAHDLCLLDPSPAATQPTDPAFATQTPWYDLACLARALDAFEEVYQMVGDRVGVPWSEVCRVGLELALGGTTTWSDGQGRLLRRLEDVAQKWMRDVRRQLLSGYVTHAGTGGPCRLEPALRLGRLLHELAYEYEHDRQEYRRLVLRHLLAFVPRPVARRTW